MSKKIFIERKRVAETHPDAPETNRRRTRSMEADESAIMALINMRNEVAPVAPVAPVALPTPSKEDVKKMVSKYVYLLPEMTDFIQYYHEIPIKCIRGYIFFLKALEKSGLKVPLFLASTMGFQHIEKRPPYYYHGALQTFVEKSPYRTHFESRLVKYGEVRIMRCEDVEILFRTHVCDDEISGITNQKRSPYEEMSVELSRYLCLFFDLPMGSKMKIMDVLQKMNEYVKINHLLIQNEENQTRIQLDEKLSKLFMKMNPVIPHMFYVYIRQHFIFENTKHVVENKVSDSGEMYVWREVYVSKDNIFHGLCREYYPDGKLKKEGFMVKNQQSGIFRTWYPNGKIRQHSSFCDNARFDISSYFNEDGTPLLRMLFHMNQPIHFEIQ